MATNPSVDASQHPLQSEFELRRAALVGEIGESLEQVLAQINALNRSLEGIITIGNEFAAVEALWSQFESVMGREGGEEAGNVGAAETQPESVAETEERTKITAKGPGL